MGKKEFNKIINKCFGINDVRCIYGSELNEEIAYRTGRAMVTFLNCKEVVVGNDMRTSSKSLSRAFIKGITDQGANVIDIGLVDTPALYFASGYLNKIGAMITASHNPAEYNGIKLVKQKAVPINEKTGLNKIVHKNKFKKVKKGRASKKDILTTYKKHILSFINKKSLGKIKVVIDAGNGTAGKMVPIIYKGLPFKITKQDFTIDGSFPVHVANPIKHENIKDLEKRVKKEKADIGMAFDGDMDRIVFVETCFFVNWHCFLFYKLNSVVFCRIVGCCNHCSYFV